MSENKKRRRKKKLLGTFTQLAAKYQAKIDRFEELAKNPPKKREPRPKGHTDALIWQWKKGNTTDFVALARHKIAQRPPSIEGNGGSRAMMAVAYILHDLDVEAEGSGLELEILREYNQRAVPPWNEADLERFILCAEEDAEGPRGCSRDWKSERRKKLDEPTGHPKLHILTGEEAAEAKKKKPSPFRHTTQFPVKFPVNVESVFDKNFFGSDFDDNIEEEADDPECEDCGREHAGACATAEVKDDFDWLPTRQPGEDEASWTGGAEGPVPLAQVRELTAKEKYRRRAPAHGLFIEQRQFLIDHLKKFHHLIRWHQRALNIIAEAKKKGRTVSAREQAEIDTCRKKAEKHEKRIRRVSGCRLLHIAKSCTKHGVRQKAPYVCENGVACAMCAANAAEVACDLLAIEWAKKNHEKFGVLSWKEPGDRMDANTVRHRLTTGLVNRKTPWRCFWSDDRVVMILRPGEEAGHKLRHDPRLETMVMNFEDTINLVYSIRRESSRNFQQAMKNVQNAEHEITKGETDIRRLTLNRALDKLMNHDAFLKDMKKRTSANKPGDEAFPFPTNKQLRREGTRRKFEMLGIESPLHKNRCDHKEPGGCYCNELLKQSVVDSRTGKTMGEIPATSMPGDAGAILQACVFTVLMRHGSEWGEDAVKPLVQKPVVENGRITCRPHLVPCLY